jgi:hypothetical protein
MQPPSSTWQKVAKNFETMRSRYSDLEYPRTAIQLLAEAISQHLANKVSQTTV